METTKIYEHVLRGHGIQVRVPEDYSREQTALALTQMSCDLQGENERRAQAQDGQPDRPLRVNRVNRVNRIERELELAGKTRAAASLKEETVALEEVPQKGNGVSRPHQALTTRCPLCKAKPGNPCKTRGGVDTREVHASRNKLRRALKAAKAKRAAKAKK